MTLQPKASKCSPASTPGSSLSPVGNMRIQTVAELTDKLQQGRLQFPSLQLASAQKGSGRYLNLGLSGEGRLLVQLGPIRAPFGISKSAKYEGLYNIALSLDDPTQAAVIQSLDASVIDLLLTHSHQIWGKQYTKEMVEEFYSQTAWQSPTANGSAPLLRVKLATRDNSIITKFYDAQGNRLLPQREEEMVPKQSTVRVILSVSSLYFESDKSCRLAFKAEQIQVLESQSQQSYELDDFAFVEDDSLHA